LLYDASIDSIYMGANKQDFLANTSLGAINSPAILGTNNFPSAINLQQMNSSENQAIGSLFGFFLAEDLDAGQLHTFDLVTGEGDDENTKVSVDGNELKVAALLNHEDSMPYRIRVRTEDNKGGFYEQVIELNISDINDQPIIADGAFSVAENRPLGTIIEIVNFSDEDTGQNVKFNILSGDPKGVFEVETNTGNILVKDPRYLDFEEMSSFELEIQAKDDGSPSASAIGYYTVTIIDEEELNVVAPKYFSPNADGINDFWEVEDVFIYKDYTLKIYNSNQQQVYSKKEYDNLWNGMFGGNDLPAGTYYYVFSNQQSLPIHTGSITLIR
jgi:gliding motility-associated-like protein